MNEEIMRGAARTLAHDETNSQNRAYMLEKEETVPEDVAVIFGYGDNREACESLASILTASHKQGSFRCYPIK